jgi:hypothetical protein
MIYLILPIKNGWIFYGKLLNFQRVYVVQPHPEIPRGVPFVIWSVGRSTKDPLKTPSATHWGVFGDAYKPTRDWVSSARCKTYLESWGMCIYIWLYMNIMTNGQWKISYGVDRSGKSWACNECNEQCLWTSGNLTICEVNTSPFFVGKSSGTIPSDIDLFPNQAKERTHGSDQVDIL